MRLPYQKDFYDHKRYFQGKDNPGDWHPAPTTGRGIPRSQLIVGVLFLAFVGVLFVMQIRGSQPHIAAPVPAETPAKQ